MIIKKLIFLFAVPCVVGAGNVKTVDFTNKNCQVVPAITVKKREKTQIKCLKEGEMPIFGFGFIPSEYCCGSNNPNYLNETHVNNYKQAGFNLVAGINEIQNLNTRELRRALDICEEFDMGYIVRDPYIYGARAYTPITDPIPTTEEFEDYINSQWVHKHPAFAGYGFIDEPTCYNYERIANAQAAIDHLLPGTLNLTTLFPSYGRVYFGIDDPSLSDWEAYQIYVTRYINECNPQILLYDYYLFYLEENSVLTPTNSKPYFESLSYFRELSFETRLPFWTTISKTGQ